jgi:hypothetical protein
MSPEITRGQPWILPADLQAMLALSGRPYVGELPTPVAQALKPQSQELLKALDTLSDLLSPLGMLGTNLTARCKVAQSGIPMTLKTIGRGDYGSVYQLMIYHESYAFKVYHPVDSNLDYTINGVWAETRTALYFPQRALKDMAQFYCANPKAGWTLCELITSDMSVDARPGPALNSFPLALGDDINNRIAGIRVDYGGINLQDQDSNNPTERIWSLPEAERSAAFHQAMATSDPAVQAIAVMQIYYLPQDERKAAFDLAMATQNPIVQARAAAQVWSFDPTKQHVVPTSPAVTTPITTQYFEKGEREKAVAAYLQTLQEAGKVYPGLTDFTLEDCQVSDEVIQSKSALSIEKLDQAFAQITDPGLLNSILGTIPEPALLDALIVRFTNNPNPAIRKAAAQAALYITDPLLRHARIKALIEVHLL